MRRKLKKHLFLTLTVLTIFPIAGCWDTNESERMVYAQGIGVDYKDGHYTVYLQVVNLSLMAKSESSGTGGPQVNVEVGHASAKSFDKAVFNLYKSTQRRIFWGHLSYLVFTENALKQVGVKATIDMLDRYRETRYRIWIYGTKEPLSKVFVTTPILDMSTALSRLSDPEATFHQSSYIRPIDMRELIIALNEPGYEASIPFISISEKTWVTDKGGHNAIKTDGIAITTKDALKGKITNNHALGYRWMNKDFVRDGLQVRSKEGPMVDLIFDKVKLKIQPVVKNSEIHFNVQIKAKAAMLVLVNKVNLASLASESEKEIKKQIIETYLKGLSFDADVYRLSEVLYRKNVKAWKQAEHNGKIPLTKDSIKLDINVKLDNGAKQREEPTLE
ncbi:spore germination protein [Neobacillus bataviensis LMG 21833]|uniref:Spore germination protein n=1 Tax=Neobacillus bataviensis LMG 21833 TaxID=1117379 RepID=K6D8V4_9BACI|nr:Ger(x)C family spore germination protein [Neobacillus bataviensis]EKN64754.1 spore germination protein [Neobacillus bataviensis LMG 21833]